MLPICRADARDGGDRQRLRLFDLHQYVPLRPSNQDEVVRINVEIVERVASRFPGFLSAAVHRSIDGTRVFYLQWESADQLAAMQGSPEFQAIARRFAGLIEFEPHECEVVHVGEPG